MREFSLAASLSARVSHPFMVSGIPFQKTTFLAANPLRGPAVVEKVRL